jgi:hypothetical protein
VEVKIGIQHANRELVIDSNQPRAEVEAAVAQAISGQGEVLELTDVKGRKMLVPSAKLAYVEIGSPTSGQVGFRS